MLAYTFMSGWVLAQSFGASAPFMISRGIRAFHEFYTIAPES